LPSGAWNCRAILHFKSRSASGTYHFAVILRPSP
jgi:hypothetical protein